MVLADGATEHGTLTGIGRCLIDEPARITNTFGAACQQLAVWMLEQELTRALWGTITFNPVASLAPGAQASWDLVVRATGEADVRFAVEMTSDTFTRPVRETESTNLYE